MVHEVGWPFQQNDGMTQLGLAPARGTSIFTTVPRDCNARAVRAIEAWLALADVKPGGASVQAIMRVTGHRSWQ